MAKCRQAEICRIEPTTTCTRWCDGRVASQVAKSLAREPTKHLSTLTLIANSISTLRIGSSKSPVGSSLPLGHNSPSCSHASLDRFCPESGRQSRIRVRCNNLTFNCDTLACLRKHASSDHLRWSYSGLGPSLKNSTRAEHARNPSYSGRDLLKAHFSEPDPLPKFSQS